MFMMLSSGRRSGGKRGGRVTHISSGRGAGRNGEAGLQNLCVTCSSGRHIQPPSSSQMLGATDAHVQRHTGSSRAAALAASGGPLMVATVSWHMCVSHRCVSHRAVNVRHPPVLQQRTSGSRTCLGCTLAGRKVDVGDRPLFTKICAARRRRPLQCRLPLEGGEPTEQARMRLKCTQAAARCGLRHVGEQRMRAFLAQETCQS